MSNEALKTALEALIAEAQDKPAKRIPTEAERDAFLKAGRRSQYGRGR